MKRFDIHIVVGHTKIILRGAGEYNIQESYAAPQLTAKAPTGGKTTFNMQKPDADSRHQIGITIHEIPEPEYVEPPKTGLTSEEPEGSGRE